MEPNCTWFSYESNDGGSDGSCFLLDDCIEIEENPQFVSGNKYCDYYNSTTTSSTTTSTTTPKPVNGKKLY